ncbi:MAG: hypothetical protein ACI91R_001953 [Vicingaceae bacterium]
MCLHDASIMNIEFLTASEILRLAEYVVQDLNDTCDIVQTKEAIYACLCDVAGLETASNELLEHYCVSILDQIDILLKNMPPTQN